MALRLRLQQILETLSYFDKYDYPLTKTELEYWSGIATGPIRKYYFLPGRSHLVKLRQQRAKFSRPKWQIARGVGEKLKQFPTIAAVFITGALAMSNSPADDDIDLMIVTYPDTLWLTRAVVDLYLYLKSLRRYPGQTMAPDKICDNLWLDTDNLIIPDRSLRTAHEILQARVLWDRANVHHRFLEQNSWVKNYLPVAYSSQKSKIKNQNYKSKFKNNPVFAFCNLLFYILQYLYMLPKKTTEKVGLGYAFFHPKSGE